MLLTLLGATLTAAGFTGYTHRAHPRWAQDRGITSALPWPAVYALAAAAALAVAAWLHPGWGAGPAWTFAAFTWLAVLAVCTDLGSRKVPWEVPIWGVVPLGLLGFAVNFTSPGLLSLAAAFLGLVVLPLLARAWTRQGLGASDVRILWAAVATCSWWIGQTWLLYGLLVACLLQLAVRAVARALGWGAWVPVPGKPSTPSTGAPRLRLELPFAPALVGGLILSVLVGAHTGYGACATWSAVAC